MRELAAIRGIQAKYSSPPLKSLAEAEEDIAKLKAHVKKVDIYKVETKNLLSDSSLTQLEKDGSKRRLSKLLKSIKKEKNGAKGFHKALMQEVDSEVNLRLNYQQIMSGLGGLEQRVRTASAQPPEHSPSCENALKRVELEMDALRKQSAQPRKYIEVSVDGSRSNSPNRRRKILLRITNSVTTVRNRRTRRHLNT